MKKIIASILILVIVLAGLWLFKVSDYSESMDNFQVVVILLLVIFGLFAAIRRIISYNRKEPAEDEYSRLIMQRSASLSYFVSLYLWLFLSYFNESIADDTEQLIGYGIICMALVFTVTYLYFRIKGVRNE